MADQLGIKVATTNQPPANPAPPSKKKPKKVTQHAQINKSDSIGTLPTHHNERADETAFSNLRQSLQVDK
jgi:hypothetical protein